MCYSSTAPTLVRRHERRITAVARSAAPELDRCLSHDVLCVWRAVTVASVDYDGLIEELGIKSGQGRHAVPDAGRDGSDARRAMRPSASQRRDVGYSCVGNAPLGDGGEGSLEHLLSPVGGSHRSSRSAARSPHDARSVGAVRDRNRTDDHPGSRRSARTRRRQSSRPCFCFGRSPSGSRSQSACSPT
jgi:hypothetical protein